MPHNNVHDYASAKAWLAGGRDKRRRPLENNTRLVLNYNGDIEVRLHSTAVVTYHPNGSVTLNTGGWDTMTTWSRIRSYSPFGHFGTVRHKGRSYHVMPERNVPLFPPNVKQCGKCHGHTTMPIDEWPIVPCAEYTGYCWRSERRHKPNDCPGHVLPTGRKIMVQCDRCHGTGTVDYGSEPDYIIFRDGIRINKYGEVIGKRNETRLSQIAKMAERAQRRRLAEQRRWVRERAEAVKNATIISDGTTHYYKGVTMKFESPYRGMSGTRYYLGQTVEADGLNTDPIYGCSSGINFCASKADALDWCDYGHVVVLTVPKGDKIIKSSSSKLRALRVEVVGIIPFNMLHTAR